MALAEFKSAKRSCEDLAGIFELDDDIGYFYLYSTAPNGETKIIDHIFLFNGLKELYDFEVSVKWDQSETKVGLFIRDELWAVFNVTTNKKYGGGYRKEDYPTIPETEKFTK